MPNKKPYISSPVYGVRSGPFSKNGPNPNIGERNDLLLADLAHRVERLRPSHRDPEVFHAEKSEIAAELRRLARAAERVHRGSGRGRAG